MAGKGLFQPARPERNQPTSSIDSATFCFLSIDVSRTSAQGREVVKGIEVREQRESEKSASKRGKVVYN